MSLKAAGNWIAVLAVVVMAIPLLPALGSSDKAFTDSPEWHLRIEGNVTTPLNFSMSDLAALQVVTVDAAITWVDGYPMEQGN
jgi:DMSO/TMAO reductase YedYZ molybdopterin-dependent catalytic subunit